MGTERMSEVDELLLRLRELPSIPMAPGLEASVRKRARARLSRVRSTPFASAAVFGTVVVYLGWALHFVSGLY